MQNFRLQRTAPPNYARKAKSMTASKLSAVKKKQTLFRDRWLVRVTLGEMQIKNSALRKRILEWSKGFSSNLLALDLIESKTRVNRALSAKNPKYKNRHEELLSLFNNRLSKAKRVLVKLIGEEGADVFINRFETHRDRMDLALANQKKIIKVSE
jgi:hypothetical protein